MTLVSRKQNFQNFINEIEKVVGVKVIHTKNNDFTQKDFKLIDGSQVNYIPKGRRKRLWQQLESQADIGIT